MLAGGCYCGAVRFEVDAIGPLVNCHCRSCRHVHGSAFTTAAIVATSGLRFTGGEAHVRRCASGEGARFFCNECGGRLYNRPASNAGITMLLVSTLDEEPMTPPIMHVNVGSKAPWYEILDELPQHEGLPTGAKNALRS